MDGVMNQWPFFVRRPRRKRLDALADAKERYQITDLAGLNHRFRLAMRRVPAA